MSLIEFLDERREKRMMEIIVVVALVGLALVFLTKNLYNRFKTDSTCCCEGTVCLKKKKTDM